MVSVKPVDLLKKAIRRPMEIPSQGYWLSLGYFDSYFAQRNIPAQKKLIRNLEEKDNFALIILDACRFDCFEKLYDNYLDGELKKVWSSGRDTFEYVSNTWTGNHKDIKYISGAPPVNSYYKNPHGANRIKMYGDYYPANHLRILDVWDKKWQKNTVMPKDMTESALNNIENKMVVHYFQPHHPYITKKEDGYKVLVDHNEVGRKKKNLTSNKFRKKTIYAYCKGLRTVLKEVKFLVNRLPQDNIIISADHGEMLGEYGMYAHPRRFCPQLRKIPWMKVTQ